MADWKGTAVKITVDNFSKHIEPFDVETYLDTDTMEDIFDQYPPANGWQIVVEKFEDQQEAPMAETSSEPYFHFVNNSSHTFTDISVEEYREYVFPGGDTIRIDLPKALSVSASRGHRLVDSKKIAHYIPAGWIQLRWKALPGQALYVA